MSLFADLGGAIVNTAANAVTSQIGADTMTSIQTGFDAVGMAASGDFEGLASLALSELSGHVGGFAGDVLGQMHHGGSGGSMIHGGISPADAVQLYREAMAATHARKNLFFISIESNYFNDFSGLFNLYAIDVERGPSEVSGSKARVGSAQIDLLTQSEPVVLRITTMDDAKGTLKKWFEVQTAAVARADGSFGVPGGPNGYALTITIQHAFAAGFGGFTGKVLCRPQSYEVGLSRREDAVEELQMSFMQLDTFL
ncbi:MAG: hypothetical protein K9L88_10650 [Chromatiaceae bacterium]|nr:hypothetical protein [Chromatiaceae bacterium]